MSATGLLLLVIDGVVPGILLGLLWKAWRALRRVDLRQQPGWCAPPLAARWVYSAALALLALYSLMGLHRVAGAPHDVLGVAAALVLQLAPLAIACTRLWRLWRDPDALWIPQSARATVAIGSGVALLAALAPFVFYRAGTLLWALAPLLPVLKIVVLAAVELPRQRALAPAREAH